MDRRGSADATRGPISPSLIVITVTELLEEAREEIEYASEQAGRSVRQQLRSIDEGLEELLNGDKVQSEPPP
jgi:hypothetical protein